MKKPIVSPSRVLSQDRKVQVIIAGLLGIGLQTIFSARRYASVGYALLVCLSQASTGWRCAGMACNNPSHQFISIPMMPHI